jgi:hypothetical protein
MPAPSAMILKLLLAARQDLAASKFVVRPWLKHDNQASGTYVL